mgnify:FL=1
MKQSSQSEKRVPRKRVRPNRTARDREIVIMWAKRIAVAVMVLILLGTA